LRPGVRKKQPTLQKRGGGLQRGGVRRKQRHYRNGSNEKARLTQEGDLLLWDREYWDRKTRGRRIPGKSITKGTQGTHESRPRQEMVTVICWVRGGAAPTSHLRKKRKGSGGKEGKKWNGQENKREYKKKKCRRRSRLWEHCPRVKAMTTRKKPCDKRREGSQRKKKFVEEQNMCGNRKKTPAGVKGGESETKNKAQKWTMTGKPSKGGK